MTSTKIYQAKWVKKNPGKKAEYQRRWTTKNPWRAKANRHNTTPEYLQLLFDKQRGCCKICLTVLSHQVHGPALLVVDHCHNSGYVRGLLCVKCNLLLGFAKDNPELLLRAVDYLKGK